MTRLLVVGGPPSSGKSAVIRKVVAPLLGRARVGYVKVDVQATREGERFARLGWTTASLANPEACPDQAFVQGLPGKLASLAETDIVIVETAGLCARCSPWVKDAPALVVLAATCGLDALAKMAPLVGPVDVCALTRGDRLSQGERQVLAARLGEMLPAGALHWVNGLTGEGGVRLARALRERLEAAPAWSGEARLRGEPPRLFCSFCLGRTEIEAPGSAAPC